MKITQTIGRWRRAAAMAAGALLFLALPPLGWWWLTAIAIAIFGALLARATPREGFAAGWWMGAVATCGVGYWIPSTLERFTTLPPPVRFGAWLLVGAFTGLTWGIAGWVAARAGRIVGVPLAAALGLLVAERWGPTVFPYPLALTLVDAPGLAQAGDLVGTWGLGALLLATAVAVTEALHARRRTPALLVCGALVAAATLYGGVRASSLERARAAAPRVLVGLVQPQIPAQARFEESQRRDIIAHLQRMTVSLLSQPLDLVVWPEAAYPWQLAHRAGRDGEAWPQLAPPGARLPPLLFGAATRSEDGGLYNSAFVRAPDGTLAYPVAKRVRVPFGEYIPVASWLGPLKRAFPRVEGLRAGDRPELLTVSSYRVGVLNCFEDLLPLVGAEEADADFLVNLTNDAWFDGAEGAQHLVQARWRAIETRRELVRAVNGGQSGHVDALGHVLVALPANVPATLRVSVAVERGRFALAPRLVPWLGPAALGALVMIAFVGWRRRRAGAT